MARDERIVFFDVGNVLIDDDPFVSEAFRLIHRAMPADRPRAQLERYLGDVERVLRFHGPLAVERMGSRCHGRSWPKLRKQIHQEISRRWWSLVRIIPGAKGALETLRDQVRLGVIANQPVQVGSWLERWGLLPLFDVVLLDSQAEVSKPDPALYRIALEQAKVDPQASLMVGDRLDNDVIPARRVGMRAVLFWLGATQKGWKPSDPWGRAMRPILDRLPAPRWDSIPPKEHPMALARCWDDLPDALTAAWAAKL